MPQEHLAFAYPNDFVTEEDVPDTEVAAAAAATEGTAEADATGPAEGAPDADVEAVDKG